MNKYSSFFSILCFIFCIGIFNNAYCQKIKLGIKGGVGSSFYLNDSRHDKTFQFSYSLGGSLKLNISKIFSIQSELLFSQKGTAWILNNGAPCECDYVGTKSRYKFHIKTYYVELPILLRLSTKGEKVNLYMISGFAPAVFLSGISKFKKDDVKYRSKINNYNFLDIGWLTAFGVEYPFFKLRNYLEPRVNIGLLNITENYNNSRWKNSTIHLTTGVWF